MKYCLILAVLTLSAYLGSGLPDPVYTIHYLRNYRSDMMNSNAGCSKSVVFGTYIHPLGPVDAVYGLLNSQQFNIPKSCQRPASYIKIFGEAQDYKQIINVNEQLINTISQNLNRVKMPLVVDWKYMPEAEEEREKAFQALKNILMGLGQKGHAYLLKAPASYFCALVKGKKFILDQPVKEFIVELYGEETGKYTTFESIFGEKGEVGTGNGYTEACPKYPTRPIFNTLALQRTFYFEKTLDSSKAGYVGSNW